MLRAVGRALCLAGMIVTAVTGWIFMAVATALFLAFYAFYAVNDWHDALADGHG